VLFDIAGIYHHCPDRTFLRIEMHVLGLLADPLGEPSCDNGRSAPRGTLWPDVGWRLMLTGQGPLSVQDFVRKNEAIFTASAKVARASADARAPHS